MINLSDEIWARLPMGDLRPRFFVETYVEKLGMETPHFSQARLMNVFSSCAEALIYIDEYDIKQQNGGYILSALDEIEACLSDDPIAKSLFIEMDDIRSELFKSIRGGVFSSKNLHGLRVICKAVLSREEDYSNSLLGRLQKAIVGDADLTKANRVLNDIYKLTDLYITHLLNKGYSPTYLFNRSELFVRLKNYSGRSFGEQFDYVTGRLNSRTGAYDVYFSLRAHKPACLTAIADDPNFKFSAKLPDVISGSNLEKLKKDFSPNVVAVAKIDATDYVTASWRVKDKLDTLLDAVTALELNPKIQVSSNCVTIMRNNNTTHTKIVNINLLIGFLASEGGTYFSNADAPIRNALTKLDEQGREQLGRSLRYLRLARESVSLEQKLLNLWIAIESIFADGENSILSGVLEYVPSFYAVTGLLRRVRYLRDMLARVNIATNQSVRDKVNIKRLDNSLTDADVFRLLRDEEAAEEVFLLLGNREHLKYKIISTFGQLKNNSEIKKRIKKTETDVTRQLRRIYFLRNKITHTGRYANIRPQLITHLLDYLAVSYMAISKSASVSNQINSSSIEDLLGAYKLGVDIVIRRSNTDKELMKIEELTPSPII